MARLPSVRFGSLLLVVLLSLALMGWENRPPVGRQVGCVPSQDSSSRPCGNGLQHGAAREESSLVVPAVHYAALPTRIPDTEKMTRLPDVLFPTPQALAPTYPSTANPAWTGPWSEGEDPGYPSTGYESLPSRTGVLASQAVPVDVSQSGADWASQPVLAPYSGRTPPPQPIELGETAFVPRSEARQSSEAMPRGAREAEQASQTAMPAAPRLSGSVPPQDAEASLVAVSVQVGSLIQRANGLAEKGALYAARAEFLQALQTLAKGLDACDGQPSHSQALAEALQAIREADDFVRPSNSAANGVDVATAVRSHRTSALKGYDLSHTPAIFAMQSYYAHAQEQLVRASGGVPIASQALHGVGKVHMALARHSSTSEQLNGPKAMAFHQAALLVDGTDYVAANELGVLLARFGHLREARSILQHAIAIRPEVETWHNLTTVHERLGEFQLASLARTEMLRAQQAVQGVGVLGTASTGSQVQWVHPMAFGNTSPDGTPQPVAPGQAVPRTANRPAGFWPW